MAFTVQEWDLLQFLLHHDVSTQRDIPAGTGMSLGLVNRSLKALTSAGFIGSDYRPTAAARKLAASSRPKRAIILAAGYGMRMIPINQDRPKGLIEIDGEPIIEHTIRQLQETGITEIVVVVGYMKESYAYLEEQFGVRLIPCLDFATRNNLYSLACAEKYMEDAYIIPCDVYCYRNLFRREELYSWYMLLDETTQETDVRSLRTREIVYISEGTAGNRVLGIAYLTAADAAEARKKLRAMTAERKNSQAFWEEIVSENRRMIIPSRLVSREDAVEINTYEQLRDLNFYSRQLRNDVTAAIQKAFSCQYDEIKDVAVVKKGLTNRSFSFSVRGERYIMRVPGEGTSEYLDRKWEGRIYELIRGRGFCDDNVYFDPETGYKISRWLENCRVCDDEDPEDIREAMRLARAFHGLGLAEGPRLNVYDAIQEFEDLWIDKASRYRDYQKIRQSLWDMQPFIGRCRHASCTTHGDLNPDNILITLRPDGSEKYDLIDWEYSACADPLLDVAAFITYSPHKNPKAYANRVIDAYYPEGCDRSTRMLIYAYCALWSMYNSNFCEYKMQLGVEMEHFALTVYRHAKDFSRIFWKEYSDLLEEKEEDHHE